MFNKRLEPVDGDGGGRPGLVRASSAPAATTAGSEGAEVVSIGPSSLSTFTQQVAGHKGEDQMLLDESGRSIFKPLNRQEARFYDLLKTHLTSPSFPAHFFPGFLGTTNHNGREYIQLENLTYGMKQPCVCDLKMGGNSKGTNAEAGIVKGFKQNVVKSITTSRTLGFRIVGLRSYQVDTATYISKSDAIPDHFIFRSSSILLLYDGDNDNGEGGMVDVKMIDFAHSYAQEEKGKIDEEYLHGMRHLRRILEDLYKRESLVGGSTAGGLVATTLERRRGRRRQSPRGDNSHQDLLRDLESSLAADGEAEPDPGEADPEFHATWLIAAHPLAFAHFFFRFVIP
ncbi:inositol polyphosphate multikinase alpha, putative [Acanthamoeba castellanii str. Neff]|uniref:Kinase n=1 Tax=Acanthamoeba castellanii (strain ATCC 30010 / Neff) TaxID=1257118 RepID=L8H5P5_ACACF|nr:inositol polyphosphate multikinase alpha, putative [Acanthamoeba castellanii str. Neff]ELR20834.1 inositol polyphosphate multikinase alpha, putative [Acanthamoeba castellanii str. Neff]